MAAGDWPIDVVDPVTVLDHIGQERVNFFTIPLLEGSLISITATRTIRRFIDVLVREFLQRRKLANFFNAFQMLLREQRYQGSDIHALPKYHPLHVKLSVELGLRYL